MSDDTYQRPRWLLSDAWRSGVAVTIASVLTTGAAIALVLLVPQVRDAERFQPVHIATVFTCFPLVHAGLTWWAFRGLSGPALDQAVDVESARWRAADERGTLWLRTLVMGGRALGWSLTIALTTLVVVMLIVVVPGLRELPVVLLLGLSMVAASWFSVVVTYAVHYARVEAEAPGGLRFPDDGDRSFADYLYVSLAAQTTFGATDVERLTPRTRSITTGQGLLAFVYGTVIVAIIVSLLLGAGAS